ncbi:MAG: hypothetical protein E7104_01120 [Prevotella sp.]|nr:hypothetical protein [Prevotella sp.]
MKLNELLKIFLWGNAFLFVTSCSNEFEGEPVNKPQPEKTNTDSVSKQESSKAKTDTIKEKIYTFETNSVPVYSWNNNDVFLGKLVYSKISSLSNFEFPANINYTNKIDISSGIYGGELYSLSAIPSYEATHSVLDKMLAFEPAQQEGFSVDSPSDSLSLRELHFEGMKRMGLPLDEIVMGMSYKKCNDTKRYKLKILSQIVGSVTMDIYEETVYSNTFSDEELAGMAMINNINIGRTAIVVVDNEGTYCLVTFDKYGSRGVVFGNKTLEETLATTFLDQPLRIVSFNTMDVVDQIVKYTKYDVDMRK